MCNHPEIFKRRDVRSPFLFTTPHAPLHNEHEDGAYVSMITRNPIAMRLPVLLTSLATPSWEDDSRSADFLTGYGGTFYHAVYNLCNIFHAHYIHHSTFRSHKLSSSPSPSPYTRSDERARVVTLPASEYSGFGRSNCFAFARFVDLSPAELGTLVFSLFFLFYSPGCSSGT